MAGALRIGLLCGALLLAAACADPAWERFERAEKGSFRRRWKRPSPTTGTSPGTIRSRGMLRPPCCARGPLRRLLPELPAALEAYESLVYNYPRASEVPRALLRTAEIHPVQYSTPSSAAADLERIRRSSRGSRGRTRRSSSSRVRTARRGRRAAGRRRSPN